MVSVRLLSNKCGATAIIVALSLVVLLGFAALAIDIGYLYSARNELQNIADASALAATRQMGEIYTSLDYDEQQSYDPSNSDYWNDGYDYDSQTIRAAAKEVASQNPSLGLDTEFTLDDADIEIGAWDGSGFNSTSVRPNAVRVTARRDDQANNPVTTFFASVFELVGSTDDPAESSVRAEAVAALTGQSTAGPGELEIPVGISKKWYEKPEFCDQPIKFHPTGTMEGCAGWHTFDESPANANRLAEMLEEMATDPPEYESPPVTAGEDELNFTGGTVASVFAEMEALYDAKKDPATGEWTTTVPVYDLDDCSNPKKSIKIIGFSTATITGVQGPPDDKEINATVECDSISPGRGGGGDFGTLGDIPGLVK